MNTFILSTTEKLVWTLAAGVSDPDQWRLAQAMVPQIVAELVDKICPDVIAEEWVDLIVLAMLQVKIALRPHGFGAGGDGISPAMVEKEMRKVCTPEIANLIFPPLPHSLVDFGGRV